MHRRAMHNLVNGLVLYLFVQASAVQSAPNNLGAVEGLVLGAGGEPLAYAKVSEEVPGAIRNGKMNLVLTDEGGRFFLGGLDPGEHILYASKEDDGYGDLRGALYAIGRPGMPTAAVEAGKVTRGVVIRLGEPGGIVAGAITDARSGEPVSAASYKLYLPDNPKIFVRTGPDLNGRFEMPAPRVPFMLEVTAAGYRPWRSESPLLVRSRSRKELRIVLVRTSGPSPQAPEP